MSGATLGLIIAIFLASRRPDYRQVAKLALPSGLFQINEPILFGLPIIMNPVMFIPFILVQPILAAITLAALLLRHYSTDYQHCTVDYANRFGRVL